MVSLRNVRMKSFRRKPLKVQNVVKRDYFSRLLCDLKVYLDLSDDEMHELCKVLASRCPINIFQGGDINNLSDYVADLKCRFPKKVVEKSRPLLISINRVQKESSFPFNLNELFVEYADYKISFLNKETKTCESEVLSAFFDYWPDSEGEQSYLSEEDLETFEYWFLEILESSYLDSLFFYLRLKVSYLYSLMVKIF